MKIVFIIWLLAVALLSIGLYRATRFEYILSNQILEIKLMWAGLFSIPKRVMLSDVESVRRLKSSSEIIPLLSGTFPNLWGKFRPSRMLIISMKRQRFFPLIIAPDDPDQFIGRISPLISGEKRTG